LEPGILDYTLVSFGILQMQTLPDVRNMANDNGSSGHIMPFQFSGVQVLWSFRNQKFSNCGPTVDVGFVKLT
jgi:hypothetical protein